MANMCRVVLDRDSHHCYTDLFKAAIEMTGAAVGQRRRIFDF